MAGGVKCLGRHSASRAGASGNLRSLVVLPSKREEVREVVHIRFAMVEDLQVPCTGFGMAEDQREG